jgi:hypothetical protein
VDTIIEGLIPLEEQSIAGTTGDLFRRRVVVTNQRPKTVDIGLAMSLAMADGVEWIEGNIGKITARLGIVGVVTVIVTCNADTEASRHRRAFIFEAPEVA